MWCSAASRTRQLSGPGTAHRDVQKALNSNDGNKRWRVQPEKQHHRGAVGPQRGGVHQRPADRPADHQAQAEDNGVSRMAARLQGNYAGAIPDFEPGRGHCAGSQSAHGDRAGQRHHGVGGAVCEKTFLPSSGRRWKRRSRNTGTCCWSGASAAASRAGWPALAKASHRQKKAMDKLPKALTGWINGVDEVTVAALWEGNKAYEENHPGNLPRGRPGGRGTTGGP